MIPAFLYYFTCSSRNRVLSRLRRLRRPKYLLSGIVGLIYFYFVFLRNFLNTSPRRGMNPLQARADMIPLAEIGFALLLLASIVLPWILPFRGNGMNFLESEIHFLFPAPLSRRSLVHFRLLKGQFRIVFGVLISVFLFGRNGPGIRPIFLFVTLWLIYSFLSFYNLGVSLALASLKEHGLSALRRRTGVLAVMALLIGSIAVWLRWFIPPPPAPAKISPETIFRWVGAVAESGPAFYFLAPFRALVRPALAESPDSFLFRLVPALGVLALTYFWLIRSDVGFEQASLEQAEQAAREKEVRQDQRVAAGLGIPAKSRSPWFQLSAMGTPLVAIFWKNLIASGRWTSRRLIFWLSVIFIVAALAVVPRPGKGPVFSEVIGAVMAGIALMLMVIGPLIRNDDLRADLLHMDQLKSYPLSGWAVILGEILAPVSILGVTQCVLIFLAFCIHPGFAGKNWPFLGRASIALSAAILLPALTLLGVLVQNATALLFPGWLQLGKDQAHGVEAMGQRLISMAGTVIVIVTAVVPAGIVFAVAFFIGFWLIGLAVLPFAALCALGVLLSEAAVAIFLLGRLFEEFDVSQELDSSGR